MTIDRYRVNDDLTALAASFGVTIPDDALNELSHHVADVLEGRPKPSAEETRQRQKKLGDHLDGAFAALTTVSTEASNARFEATALQDEFAIDELNGLVDAVDVVKAKFTDLNCWSE